ncbi:malonate decarboxylase subunit alpha [Rhodococcus sp. ACPA1]|uniref:malonate decarboxylase subunit alpha n=1 Tax=Rhodococcus sp. ACPA1 TaxID=2028572 RepID=UPI000BB11CCC|nr:malonate decarboxylase subunit alpha [Rhodococcus sp. ACPA1]PBC47504.1 malonate decarboxylase subunit alpha [Rhodococcus sp. ACPA1]
MPRTKNERLRSITQMMQGKVLDPASTADALQRVLEPGDRVALEGNNQKQADYLSRSLAQVSPRRVHDLHMVMPCLTRQEHLDLFESGLARRADFAYCGPLSQQVARAITEKTLQTSAIHTYLELYARMYLDLAPQVALVAAEMADTDGNLYTGANTEETPVIVEAAAFRGGVVIAQVNEIVSTADLPRVDIPGSWVDVVVEADRPYHLEALFTRDPAKITDMQVLMAMTAIRGVYERHSVTSLNHGIGYNTAAIELLLPTYGESLGLRGKICLDWAVNPHPTLIPAIETGWVRSVMPFGGEVGMNDYVNARPTVFPVGADGTLRSNRMAAQTVGLYGTDMFIGSTLQIDSLGNSSTVSAGRITGFGGAPNLGNNPGGRRHSSPAWASMAESNDGRGRKLVVQIVQTQSSKGVPHFVESLDAVQVGREAGFDAAPVMIYGDDITHIVTEQGVAYLHKARDLEERKAAVSWAAGGTPLALSRDRSRDEQMRRDGLIAAPEDIGVNRGDASRKLLAAQTFDDLITWSDGLYVPPVRRV